MIQSVLASHGWGTSTLIGDYILYTAHRESFSNMCECIDPVIQFRELTKNMIHMIHKTLRALTFSADCANIDSFWTIE